MFGRIFGRKNRMKELEAENKKLIEDVLSKSMEIEMLYRQQADLLMQLKPFKPVLTNPKLKPAVTPFCELCNYRVMNRDKVIGCCKDNVCDDFARRDE